MSINFANMKKGLISLLLGIALTSISAAALDGSTVLDDFWSAISAGRVQIMLDSGAPLTRASIERCLKIKDFANGYLKLECGDFVNAFVAAIFKRKDGRRLLVVVSEGDSVENRYFLLFDRKKNQWMDVQKQVWPQFSDVFLLSKYRKAYPDEKNLKTLYEQSVHSPYRTRLPQKGTTVTIEAGLDLERKPLFELSWDKAAGKFKIVDSTYPRSVEAF